MERTGILSVKLTALTLTKLTKKRMPKSYKMRYHFLVLVDLNKCKQKHYGTTYRLISTVGWYMKNTRA